MGSPQYVVYLPCTCCVPVVYQLYSPLETKKQIFFDKKNTRGLAYVKKKQYLCSGFWDKGRKNDGKSPINNDN